MTVYKTISRAKKRSKTGTKAFTRQTRCIENKILKTIHDKLHSSTRGIAIDINNDGAVNVSHETVGNVLQKYIYFSRVARKKPLLSTQNNGKRYKFAMEHISLPP